MEVSDPPESDPQHLGFRRKVGASMERRVIEAHQLPGAALKGGLAKVD